jgi:O-antigen/teichoic acid export membrane protein
MSKLLKNSLIYTIGNVVTALSAFFLLPLYTKYLTVSDFGITSSMQIISSVLVIISSLALERSLFRVYYDYHTEKEQRDFLGTIFLSILGAGFVSLLLCFLASRYLNMLFSSISFHPYYTLTIFYSFVLSIINFTQTIAQVRQNAKQFIFISITTLLVTVTANLIFILKFQEGALGYLKGVLYGGLFVIPFALYYIHSSINYTFNRLKLKSALLFSLPILPSLIGAWVLNLSDRIFIDKFYTLADVAIYSLGYRIASLVVFMSSAIFMSYNPLFYNIANRKDLSLEAQKTQIYRINSAIIILIGIIGLGILLFSDAALKLFFPKNYMVSYSYLSVLILSFIIGQVTGLFNLMIYQNKKTKSVAIITICCAGLNIGLNYFLIPLYGVFCAVLSNLICNCVNFLLIYWLAKKNYFINIDWMVGGKILMCYTVVYFINRAVINESIIILMITKVISFSIILMIFKKSIITLYFNFKRSKQYI